MHPSPDPDPTTAGSKYIPPVRVPSPPLKEVFRIITERGYCVVGAPKFIFESENYMGQIEKLEEEREVTFCALQMLPLDRLTDFSFKDYGVEGERSQNDIDWDTKEEMYCICLVRKQ